jgi:hypothetical protein
MGKADTQNIGLIVRGIRKNIREIYYYKKPPKNLPHSPFPRERQTLKTSD